MTALYDILLKVPFILVILSFIISLNLVSADLSMKKSFITSGPGWRPTAQTVTTCILVRNI